MVSNAPAPLLDWMNPQSDNFQTVHQATDRHGRQYKIVTALSMAGTELVAWLTITSTDDEGKRSTLHQVRCETTQGAKVSAATWFKSNTPVNDDMKARTMASTLTDEALCIAWAATEQFGCSRENAIVRGWITDELNARLGDDLFDQWLYAFDKDGNGVNPLEFFQRRSK